MGLEDVKELKETRSVEEANSYLETGDWRVVDVKVEKLRIPTGEKQVVESKGHSGLLSAYLSSDKKKYEPVFEEQLSALYVLGRFQ